MPAAQTPAVHISGDVDTDARFAITHVATSIANADAKAGLLAAALTFTVAAVAGQGAQIAKLIRSHSVLDGFALLAMALAVLALVVSALHVLRAVQPRVDSADSTRFDWPSLADADVEALMAVPPAAAGREAWLHAKQLSLIARAKFAAIAVALRWFALGGAFLLTWSFLAR